MLALAKLAHFYCHFILSLVINRQVETDPSWVRVIVHLHCHFFFFLHFCPFMFSICLPVSICKFAVQGLHPHLVSELSRMCIFAWNWREASMRNMIFSQVCFCFNQHVKCRYGKKHATHWGIEVLLACKIVFLMKIYVQWIYFKLAFSPFSVVITQVFTSVTQFLYKYL